MKRRFLDKKRSSSSFASVSETQDIYLTLWRRVIETFILTFFATGNPLLCGEKFEPAKYITMYVVPKKHFFKIS